MLEKLQGLTSEQKQELNKLGTAEQVLKFTKQHNLNLTHDEAGKIALALPDDALEGVAGGFNKSSSPTLRPR